MTEDPKKAIAFQLHDSVMVLAPAGWNQVELELKPTPAGLRLVSLSTRGEGAKAPRPRPKLGIANDHEAHAIGEGLSELSHLLGHDGKHWPGLAARLRRGPEHADLELLDGDKVVWLCRLDKHELEQLLITDELLEALLGTEAGFEQLQTKLTVDEQAKRLVLGSYDAAEFVWRWNHADPDVRRVCAVDAHPPGLSALWRPGFACDEGFAWVLCSHVAMALGARGLVRAEGEPVLLAAVK